MMSSLPPREPRFVVDLPVALTVGDDDAQVPAKVKNLSRGGLCVEATCDVGEDGFVGLELDTQEHGRILMFAVVRWRTSEHLGLEIGGMHPRHRFRHDELLASLTQNQK